MIAYLIKIFLILLLLISIFFLLLLFVPFRYNIFGKKEKDYQLYVEATWFFRLFKVVTSSQNSSKVSTEVYIFHKRLGEAEHKEKGRKTKIRKKEDIDKKGKSKERKRKKNIPVSYIFNHDFFKAIKIFIKDLFRWLKPKKFILNGRIGFSDPYHTGIICAALAGFTEILQKTNIKLLTSFDQEILEGDLTVEGKLRIAALIYIILKLVLSRQGRKIIFYQIRR